MKKPSSASDVFPISRAPLSVRKPTDRGFPAVVANTSNKIRKILDAAGNNDGKDINRERLRTPPTPIDTDTLRRSMRSDHPGPLAASPDPAPGQNPAPRPSGKRYSVFPKPPIEEVIDAPFSQRPSEIPTAKRPIFPNRRSIKDAFSGLSQSARRAIIELDVTKENNDIFMTRYRELKSDKTVVPTLINSLSTLLNERIIDLPPQFIYKGSREGDTKWVIIECSENSLDTPFPMVQVLPEDELNSPDCSPIAIPLRIVFISNVIQ